MIRRQVLIAAAVWTALILLAVFAAASGLLGSLRSLFRPDSVSSFDWLSRTLAECEEDAVNRPEMLNFLVVPLAQGRNFNPQWQAKALSNAGKTVLFGSQDALAALKANAVRISARPYVLHTLDTASNSTHRWTSASGVARLSTTDIASDGPFSTRFQTTPDDASQDWSSITAEGRGTCHWAFALMRD